MRMDMIRQEAMKALDAVYNNERGVKLIFCEENTTAHIGLKFEEDITGEYTSSVVPSYEHLQKTVHKIHHSDEGIAPLFINREVSQIILGKLYYDGEDTFDDAIFDCYRSPMNSERHILIIQSLIRQWMHQNPEKVDALCHEYEYEHGL